MRKIMMLWVLICVVITGNAWADGVQVILDSRVINMDDSTGAAFVDQAGRVMVPLRVVAEAAGKSVSYYSINRVAYIKDGESMVSVPIDKPYIFVNHQLTANDAPATIVNGRAYLPIRLVMEAFGFEVKWDRMLFAVVITSGVTATESIQEPEVVVETVPQTIPNIVGNSNINLYNGGLIARENDELFYVNFEDSERIWHVNLKTGASNKISERTARGINVVEGWVYYRQQAINNIWELYKTREDGSDTEMVATGNVEWLYVDSENIYYYLSDQEVMNKMKIEKPYSTIFYDGPLSSINMDGERLVYTEMVVDNSGDEIPGNVISVDIATREKKIILSERSGWSESLSVLLGNKLYFSRYSDALSLYSLDIDTGDVQKINNRRIYNFSGDSKKLLTLYPDKPAGLFLMQRDGSEETKIDGTWSATTYYDPHITLIDNQIFFLKKTADNEYRWLCYDSETGQVTTIMSPEDFIKIL